LKISAAYSPPPPQDTSIPATFLRVTVAIK